MDVVKGIVASEPLNARTPALSTVARECGRRMKYCHVGKKSSKVCLVIESERDVN